MVVFGNPKYPKRGPREMMARISLSGGAANAIVPDSKGNLFAAIANNNTNKVLVYHFPLRSSSVPAFAIQHGIVDPTGLAIDSHGDLFVSVDNRILECRPPYSASSQPALVPAKLDHQPGSMAIDNKPHFSCLANHAAIRNAC